jgi:linoleoyl-CoA desaturase
MGGSMPDPTALPAVPLQYSRSVAAIKFTSGGAFHRDVDREVRALLADGRVLRRGYLLLWAKAGLVLGWAAGSYIALLFFSENAWWAAGWCVSLGLALAGIGFTIMHDANHGAFARRRSVNRVMALSLDLIGGSSYVWAAKHLAHHTYPNVSDHDPDIDALPLARLDPAQRRQPWHRFQHLYAWPAYGLITIRWQFYSDFRFLQRGTVGHRPLRPPQGRALATMVAGKLVFLTWALVVPLALHPVLPVLACALLVSYVASIVLTVIFQLSHCAEETAFVDPAGEGDSRAWQIHQVETTIDFARDNRLLTAYLGGLNHQIEHHLYPRLPHTIHHRIAPIVEAAAHRHGIRYTSQPSLRCAIRSHCLWLREMGCARA